MQVQIACHYLEIVHFASERHLSNVTQNLLLIAIEVRLEHGGTASGTVRSLVGSVQR